MKKKRTHAALALGILALSSAASAACPDGTYPISGPIPFKGIGKLSASSVAAGQLPSGDPDSIALANQFTSLELGGKRIKAELSTSSSSASGSVKIGLQRSLQGPGAVTIQGVLTLSQEIQQEIATREDLRNLASGEDSTCVTGIAIDFSITSDKTLFRSEFPAVYLYFGDGSSGYALNF